MLQSLKSCFTTELVQVSPGYTKTSPRSGLPKQRRLVTRQRAAEDEEQPRYNTYDNGERTYGGGSLLVSTS